MLFSVMKYDIQISTHCGRQANRTLQVCRFIKFRPHFDKRRKARIIIRIESGSEIQILN